MKRIIDIELVFENCECAKIPFEHIYMLNTGKIEKELDFCTGSWQNSDEFRFIYTTDFIEIDFLNYKTLMYMDNNFEHKEKLLKDRLSFCDITSVCIHYQDIIDIDEQLAHVGNTEELQIYVPWKDESSMYVNKLQKLSFKDKGDQNKHTIQDEDITMLVIKK